MVETVDGMNFMICELNFFFPVGGERNRGSLVVLGGKF